jgi:DNA-directed RNA polymerase subunit M/transcription elongation factor TFIIS
MADPIAVTCPKCDKALSVPAALAGKKVRCKGCEAAVSVPAPKAAESFKLAEEPKAAKPKKVAKAAKAAKPAEPVRPKADDDLDNDTNPYAAQADDLHIARCAFCAKPLDPPDARICLNCGFDRLERKRFESKAVFELTFGEYLGHHLVTILAFFGICILIAICVTCLIMMPEWFKGSVFETGDKDPVNDEPKYYVNPGFVTLWVTVISLFLMWYAGRFIYRMLVHNFRPTELRTGG